MAAGMIRSAAWALATLTALSACSGNDRPLEGQRFGTRVPLADSQPNAAGEFPVVTGEQLNEARDIALPGAQTLAAWPQRGGNAQNLIPHAAISATPAEIWATDIGSGNRSRARITADPVAANGRIFTLDALGQVQATSAAGETLWRADLTAGFDRGGGISGGGLATAGGTVFASTGYGELVALQAETGAELWRQRLGAGVTTPSVADGVVYAVSRDNAAWAIDAANGRIRWQLPAAPAAAALSGGAAPAVTDRAVIFPFASGEIVAALRQSGVRVWGSTVAGARAGVAYNNLNDITSDPVVLGGTVYAGNQSGRVVAMDAVDGSRLWTATEGAYSPLLSAGGSLFFVSDRNELIRIDAANGGRVWGAELSLYQNNRVRRRRAVFTHYGPILVGGQLLVASGDGAIRLFDPRDGSETGQLSIRGGAASNPIVMNGTIYVVSDDGRLHAYR